MWIQVWLDKLGASRKNRRQIFASAGFGIYFLNENGTSMLNQERDYECFVPIKVFSPHAKNIHCLNVTYSNEKTVS
jgi:hypothetical protein